MDILTNTLSALWQVIAVGLLLGAGVPAMFSIGMRSLEFKRTPAPAAVTTSSSMSSTTDGTVASTAGKVGAGVCFGVCILAVLLGIVVIIFGKQLFG